jgi:protein involved in ribonucleotide reduction
MLHIAYFSNESENTHRFMQRLLAYAEAANQRISATRLNLRGDQPIVNEDYILIVPSYGTERTGHTPPQVKKFLTDEITRNHCVGVIGTGNINFGDEYAAAGEVVSLKLQVPLLHKIELSGFPRDTGIVFKLASLDRDSIKNISEKNQKGKAA